MKVKVCGMREAENIRAVEEAGADYMGFICYDRSPRYVAETPTYLPSCRRVGVFVNADYATVLHRIKALKLDLVQLHGKESPELCCLLKQQGVGVIKAFALRHNKDVTQTIPYDNRETCDFFLFDTPCESYGGSGHTFNWQLLESYTGHTPFFLSGGLNADSLSALTHFHHPRWIGIDVNSGFETAPALKDSDALRTFIKQFKNI